MQVYATHLRIAPDLLLIHICPNRAIADYAQRWGIEALFGIFKTRGFCLESTHLTDAERLSKLLAVLSLALCWVILMDKWLNQIKALKRKKHGRKAKSIFRYGFDHLRHIVLNLEEKTDEFWHVLQFLSGTYRDHFHPKHHQLTAQRYREQMRQRIRNWQEIVDLKSAAQSCNFNLPRMIVLILQLLRLS